MAGLVLAFARVLALAVDPATVDVRHFSLYPWNGARVLRLAGILALHVAALWAATLVLIAARGAWRLPSSRARHPPDAAARCGWRRPSSAGAISSRAGWQLPIVGLLLSAVACAVAALLARRVVVWYRHATIAARIFGLFVTFLVPAVLLYPSLNFFAEQAIERLITIYAVEAQNHSATLLGPAEGRAGRDRPHRRRCPTWCRTRATRPARPDPKNAFFVWSQTVFARARLTSAVELYNRQRHAGQPLRLEPPRVHRERPPAAGGAVVSVGRLRRAAADRVAEAPRAARGAGALSGRGSSRAGSVGTIVLHLAVDDYRTLPFITSQSPYFELFRPSQNERRRAKSAPGNDVHVAIYGWGLEPVYTSGLSAWPITDDALSAHLPSRPPAVLGNDPARRGHLSGLLHQRPRPHLRHRVSAAHAVRPPGAPGRGQHARRRGLRARAPGHRPSSPGSAASGRASAAPCCARFAPASTASCSWRSSSPRSSRC